MTDLRAIAAHEATDAYVAELLADLREMARLLSDAMEQTRSFSRFSDCALARALVAKYREKTHD